MNTDGLTLYHFNSCPFCLRVRLALWRMGESLPMRNIKRNPEDKAELIAGGGKKQVPCLRIESEGGGDWLYESADIIDYLHQRAAQ